MVLLARKLMMQKLLIIGGGPKAMAVVAKVHVLRELGFAVPDITVVEPVAVGANWMSEGGWTSGKHRLGTSPSKDVGFPYHSTWARGFNAAVNEAMLAFSWNSFLVDRGAYADWVDRGQPSPPHHLWAKYLQWVARQVDYHHVVGAASGLRIDGDRWVVSVDSDAGRIALDADAVMMTGPGSSRGVLAEHPKVLSIARFWELASRRELPATVRAAVVGGGETAASALDELLNHDMMSISAISPAATLYTRGESYFENSLYSNPATWRSLSLAERRDVLRRTDRGVFSVRVQESLLGDERVHHLQGRVTRARAQGDGVAVTLSNQGRADEVHSFDLVIDATGGNPLWFLALMDAETRDIVELSLSGSPTQARIESSIGYDLGVDGLPAKLYLPNLAGVAQGAGFPNLSCLGELSDRVLSGCTTRPDDVSTGSGRMSETSKLG